jgi:hypothetical protein
MPSTSKKQHNFMAAVAHNPAFAKKVGIPQSVGKEFNNADKGKTFKQGGDMKKMAMGGSVKPSAMGKVKTAAPSRDGIAVKGKTKGAMPKMAGNSIGTGKPVNTMKKGGMAKC